MNEEELRAIALAQKELESEKLRRMEVENQYSQNNNANFNSGQDKNVVEFQLDLKEELDRIYHLLRGDILEVDREGNNVWVSPDDDRLKILSDYGVKQIMNIIYFYINKNTLLSNYDEDTIYWKVRDFGVELADLVFNRYEMFFAYKTPEQLYDELKELMLRFPERFKDIDDAKLYAKCIRWSKEELQSKLRHYPMIITALVDSVHSTYLRAMNGEERSSLRKQMNIHQSLSDQYTMDNSQSKYSVFNPKRWTGK